jgi:protoporphyrinogen oxidase
VKALASAVRPGKIAVGEPLVTVDLEKKVAKTPSREIRFERLVSSVPLDRFARLCGIPHDGSVFSWNKVLVFNLGFDRKGPRDMHWVYYPRKQTVFYRIGFYDNIFDTDRLSLYVEIGFPKDATVDVPALEKRVLADLEREGITKGHRLVASHSVVMDPAYVHITRASMSEQKRLAERFRDHSVYSIGRYGSWTYCSIEDNIVEARALAASF